MKSNLKKWVKDLNKNFVKKEIKMSEEHMKRCSISF